MAEGRSRRGDRPTQWFAGKSSGRSRRVVKPMGWPRYMIEKPLRSGVVHYYWNPPNRDILAGFTLHREALGPLYGDALSRATMLNAQLDAWREGRSTEIVQEAQAGYGTLGWLFDRYRRSQAYRSKVGERARSGYERSMRAIEDLATTDGRKVAMLPLAAISTRAVDRIYERLQNGPRKANRTRQANYALDIARRAWKVVHRL